MQFPPALTLGLEALLEGVPRKELVAAAQKMSAGYRQGETSQPITTPLAASAYAVARMPATFAACAAVFARLAEVMPAFAPVSLLDVGAGTGAASWAAVTEWRGIADVTMLDRNPALRALARRLADSGPLVKAEILGGDLSAEKPKADLVVASYVLAELPQEQVASVARELWQSTNSALALIEPGTPDGFARIRAARTALIEAGAHVAAPCTHDNACPMRSVGESRSDKNKVDDWCHFSQRLPRSRDHMLLKDATVPFEDERYCYVAVTREKVAKGARILAPPLQAKPGLTFKLCDETGLHARFVATRDKDEYRRVRKLGWGDLF
ncbi:MAG TPA: small ribosomal subunit Rsm22 family protein [Rhizomicrobium sp.]|nr:small ribosomal subunit Rsm22 family protein [Rhizomicrobium sp.]